MATLHAFDLLAKVSADTGTLPDEVTETLPEVILLVGSDSTLRTWCRPLLTGDADITEAEGESAMWPDLRDDLSTASLFAFGERRSVVIRGGDAFVKRYRAELETYAAEPSSAGRLVMELDTLASNTRLYKAAAKKGWIVECKPPIIKAGRSTRPDVQRLRTFLMEFVAPRHRCQINQSATDRLIELIGDDVGLLDTEIAKLAVHLPVNGKINEALVIDIVAGWKGKTMWDIIEAAASGNTAEALQHVDRLLTSGQRPIALLPQLAWSLRRLGMATAAVDAAEQQGRKISLTEAFKTSGFRGSPQDMQQAERQLKQIGRHRGRQILPWLLEADLRLKGSHSVEGRDRWVLEELFLKFAREAN